MTQQELYKLAKELNDKEIAYLISSHLEHIRKESLKFNIDCQDRTFVGEVRVIPK